MFGMFGEDLMDRWMDDMEHSFFGRRALPTQHKSVDLMRTDVHDNGDSYEVHVELPGYKKDEIELNLEKGYLTINATKNVNNDQTDASGKIIRQERYSGNMSRSFYVGERLTEEDIKAKLEDGVLSLSFPKEESKPQLPEKKIIAIEG